MKKSILKTIAAIMLFGFVLSSFLLNSCKKNVGDAYPYEPVELNPDFEITSIDYAIDNGELNSESELSFKVTYKNSEVTKTTYTTVLNFYVDGVIQESKMLENIAANSDFEAVFNWKALAGPHDFKFAINLSSDGQAVVKETNTTNNAQTTDFDIPVKSLTAVNEVPVESTVVEQAVAADPEADIAQVLASEGISISTTVNAVQTNYSDNTTAIVAAVAKGDGTIDSSKVVLSFTCNPGVSEGQKQESTTTLIVETVVEQKETSFYNANEKLIYNNGVLSLVGLKSAKVFSPCSEPSNLQAFFASESAKKAFTDGVRAAIAQQGLAAGLSAAREILISVLEAYNFTQGNIDNPPTYTYEIINSSAVCSTDCVNGFVVNTLSYPGFILHFSDDRNSQVRQSGTTTQISTFTKAANCSASNKGTYTFEDCGGNKVTYTFNVSRPVIATSDQCVADVHN